MYKNVLSKHTLCTLNNNEHGHLIHFNYCGEK